MSELKDRHVLITGAAGALAQSVGRHLASLGARVSGIDRDDGVHARVKSFGGAASFVASLSDPAEVDSSFDAAERTLGKLWALVHVAGGWKGGTPVAGTDVEVFDAMIDTNLRTTFIVARSAMRRLTRHGGGRIVTTGSFTAAKGIRLSGSAAYNASKAGVISLTQALAEEGLGDGVLANSIAPDTMDTPGNRAGMPNADPSSWVSTDAVAAAVAALCSPNSSVSGSVLAFPARG